MDHALPAIQFISVTKRFPGVLALIDVSFDVRKGELHSICGENGAGKSTLMKILSGVQTDYEGTFKVKDQVVRFSGTKAAEEAGIGIIHQELNLVEELSAAANIFLGREIRNVFGVLNDREMARRSRELLRELECDIDPNALAGTLRVGDQQLLEIAKALSLNTDILIMDEPTSALTETEVARLYRVIEKLRARDVTILYISHKMDEVFRLSDRITVLRDGQVIRTLDADKTNAKEITHLMVGREIEESQIDRPKLDRDVVLDVKSLTLSWPGHARNRLTDVSFSLYRGEILAIAGLMGAGRTELLECLFGATKQSPEGEIRLNGQLVRFTNPVQAKRAGIAMVTEDRKRLGVFPQMTVRDNITICTLFEYVTAGVVRRKREMATTRDSIARLKVKTASSESSIASLSGGNQQKTILGRWLLTNPTVLLLDDPTRGVDVGAKAELYRLMADLSAEGISIVLTSSELPELLTVADRILVLSEGRLTAEFDREEATEQKIMEAATE